MLQLIIFSYFMTPLNNLLEIIKKFSIKPINFWGVEEQKNILRDALSTIKSLKETLEHKELTTTQAYKAIKNTENILIEDDFNEVKFVQTLGCIIDIYLNTPTPNTKNEELLKKINKTFTTTKTKILEHHILLEKLINTGKKLTPEEQQKNDLEVIQKIGIFYVLEYTLQVLYEFTYLDNIKKRELLTNGLQTKAGNIPAYYLLEDTFRKELCYKIFNPGIRQQLLSAFYKLEENLYNENLKNVFSALRTFNLDILNTFSSAGLTTFTSLLYKPFGDNLPISELINKIDIKRKTYG